MTRIDFTDSTSTPNAWSEQDIEVFMGSFNKSSFKKKSYTTVQGEVKFKKKNSVDIDDPRPPIKQRHGIEGEIGKCPHCHSDLVYHDQREEWLCGFCET